MLKYSRKKREIEMIEGIMAEKKGKNIEDKG